MHLLFLGKSFVYYLMSEDSLPERECIVHAIDAYGAGMDTVNFRYFLDYLFAED